MRGGWPTAAPRLADRSTPHLHCLVPKSRVCQTSSDQGWSIVWPRSNAALSSSIKSSPALPGCCPALQRSGCAWCPQPAEPVSSPRLFQSYFTTAAPHLHCLAAALPSNVQDVPGVLSQLSLCPPQGCFKVISLQQPLTCTAWLPLCPPTLRVCQLSSAQGSSTPPITILGRKRVIGSG